MNRAGLVVVWLNILAVAIAVGVTGSVWGGLIVAALEIGFFELLRARRQPQ